MRIVLSQRIVAIADRAADRIDPDAAGAADPAPAGLVESL